MTRGKKPTKCKKVINSKNNTEKNEKNMNEKIDQFYVHIKDQCYKKYKNQCGNYFYIVKITDRNAGMQNEFTAEQQE